MRKPLNLVDTRSCPRECLEIRQRNLENSAFLRLPAELRNRIYEEVLANKTIHIGHYACPPYKTGAVRFATFYRRHLDNYFNSVGDEKPLADSYLKLSHAICEARESESFVYDRCKTCNVQDGCQWNSLAKYDSRHEHCLGVLQDFDALWLIPSLDDFRDPTCEEAREEYLKKHESLTQTHMGSQLHLDILRVCRQTHKEAALLPYQLNTFAFTCGFTMDRFISGNLIAAQKEAIGSIQLGGWLRSHRARSGISSIRSGTILSLRNLTSIQITLPDHLSERNDGALQFYGLGIDTARVLIANARNDAGEKHCGLDCRLARRVSGKIEGELKRDDGKRYSFSKSGVAFSEPAWKRQKTRSNW